MCFNALVSLDTLISLSLSHTHTDTGTHTVAGTVAHGSLGRRSAAAASR